MKTQNAQKSAAFTMAGAGQRTPLTGLLACGHAFTMAEILLSLTIIGVVAAITLPSLTGNINERTWTTQRKALFSRISQAAALMPTMNGFGTSLENHAEAFVTSGLSKVLKLNNICGYGTDGTSLKDCGFPEKIVVSDGTKVDLPKQLTDLNSGIPTAYGSAPAIKNTKAAALETANGESMLVFYNPNCIAQNVLFNVTDGDGTTGSNKGYAAKHAVCANFIFDLNGKKGPNTIGKDVGTMSILYSSDPAVVMPMYPRKGISGQKKFDEAKGACKALDEGQYRLPNVEELLAIFYNRKIYGENIWATGEYVWSSTLIDSTHAYSIGFNHGNKYITTTGTSGASRYVVCVQR